MVLTNKVQHKKIFESITILKNERRFKIVELTQEKELTISELSKLIELRFNICTNYVTALEKAGLVTKRRDGKNVFVKSKVKIFDNSLILG